MRTQTENRMGTAPMWGLIWSMSLPAMFSMFVQAMYNIVDSMFVAQLGEKALTAVSLAYPIQNLILAVAVGTGVGLNSVISRRLGEKKLEAASQAASHGLMLGILSGAAFALLGVLFTRPFFEAFTQDVEVVSMGCTYITIVTVLCFGSIIHICMEKVLQATGNMFYPMLFQLAGAVTNLILDPIMIFGFLGFPALGVAGAAIATVTGQMVSMGLSLFIVFTKTHQVQVSVRGFRPDRETLADIYAVGIPSMVMQSIGSLLTTLLNAILIGFSGAAVSVLAVYNRVQSFVFMPVFGLNQGLMPIMGYNYGAGSRRRLMDCLRHGLTIATAIMLVGTAIFMVWPETLLRIFNSSPEMMQIGVEAFRVMSPCFVFAGFGLILSTMFQALGNGSYSLAISVIRQLVVVLPVAYFMAKYYTLSEVWLAMPASELVASIVCVFLFRSVYHAKIQALVPIEEPEELVSDTVTAD